MGQSFGIAIAGIFIAVAGVVGMLSDWEKVKEKENAFMDPKWVLVLIGGLALLITGLV